MLILEFPCLALEDIPPAPGSALAVSHGECLLPCKPTKSDPFFKGTVSQDYRPFWSNNYMGPYELFRRIFCYFPKIFAKNACPRSQWLDLTTSCTFNGDIFQNEYTRISTPKNEIVPVPEQSHVLWILISIFTLSLIWAAIPADNFKIWESVYLVIASSSHCLMSRILVFLCLSFPLFSRSTAVLCSMGSWFLSGKGRQSFLQEIHRNIAE